MHTGERIKLLRIADGLTQQYLAELLGVTQGVITRIESGKSKPSFRSINILSHYFIVSKDWLKDGTTPAIINGWGYATVPFKGWHDLPSSTKASKLKQIADVMGTLFVDFLRESHVTTFFTVHIQDSDDVIFVFPIGPGSTFVLRFTGELTPMLEDILKDTGLQEAKSILIPDEMAYSIHQSSSPLSRMEHIIELHNMLGLGELTQTWSDIKHPYDLRSAKVYQNRINKVCRDILAKGLDPADVIHSLKNMTDARLNYQFKNSVDFLLSRSKSPLFKSRSEKFRNGDDSPHGRGFKKD